MYFRERETDPVYAAQYVDGLKKQAAARLAAIAEKKRKVKKEQQ